MPHMIPPRPGADTPDSERRLFEELERQLPATWTVFHARTFVEAGSGGEMERSGPWRQPRLEKQQEALSRTRTPLDRKGVP